MPDPIDKKKEDNVGEKPMTRKNDDANGKDEAEKIEDSGRLFVRNIPFSTTEDDLRELDDKQK